jgi:hypothetical protein
VASHEEHRTGAEHAAKPDPRDSPSQHVLIYEHVQNMATAQPSVKA